MTTGLTAYVGMITVGEVADGDTVVVSAAAGAVGTIACQLAKIAGARVIGIAGGAAKTDYLLNQIGCDAAIDYKSEDVAAQLKLLAPDGIDVFFDSSKFSFRENIVSLLLLSVIFPLIVSSLFFFLQKIHFPKNKKLYQKSA